MAYTADLFPANAEFATKLNSDRSVDLTVKILQPDDPTKPPEKVYRTFIVKFYDNFVDDNLKEKIGKGHYNIILERIHNQRCTKYN